jgi:DNA-directed RNA polymerase specialized sigma24 family protein
MQQLQEMYPDIERQVMPLIIRGADRLANCLGGYFARDDAIQAGRIVVWKALPGYDCNKGGLKQYVQACLYNAYLTAYHKAIAKRRMPRVVNHDGVGGYETRPLAPIPLSYLSDTSWSGVLRTPDTWNTEEVMMREDDASECELNIKEIRETLDVRQQFIFDTLLSPPEELMAIHTADGWSANDPPKQTTIVKWLEPLLTKNQVDHSIHKIRRAVIAHAERGQFSDEFYNRVKKGWTPKGAKRASA